MTPNKERLQKIASWRETYGAGSNVMLPAEEAEAMASMLLEQIDSEPFAYIIQDKYERERGVDGHLSRSHVSKYVSQEDISEHEITCTPLYRHAQSAQISEPVLPLQDKDLQGVIDALEHPAGINAAGKQVVRHALVEIQERRKADREPVAEVVSIYGDPEAFGEREIRPLVGIQQMPYGTKLYRHAQPAPVVPDSYVMVPMRLTAENGAKGALSGEFSETRFVNCPECFGDDECETCDGSGKIEITVPVTWTTIKEIWAKGVEHFSATPREVKGE